jgi:hypothetical protein
MIQSHRISWSTGIRHARALGLGMNESNLDQVSHLRQDLSEMRDETCLDTPAAVGIILLAAYFSHG